MSPLWAVAPLAAVAAIVVLAVMLRDLARAARDLGDEAGRYAELGPALVSFRTELERSRAAATRLRHH